MPRARRTPPDVAGACRSRVRGGLCARRRASRCSRPSSTATPPSRGTTCSTASSGAAGGHGLRHRRLRAPTRSGSAKVDAYVVCPCSMSTVGTLAAGAMANLIHRAASVALKEGRKLVLVPRETPLSLIHLRGLATLQEAGATILFAAPGFYHGAETIDDLVDFVVARCLDQLGSTTHSSSAGGSDARSGTLPPGRGRGDVRPDRAGLRRDEPRHDRRPRPALAPAARSRPSCSRATACSTRAAARATSRSRPAARAGDRRRPRLLAADARAGAAEVTRDRMGPGRPARAALRRRVVRCRDGRLRRPQRRRPRARRCASCAACCAPAAGSRSSRSPSRAGRCGRSSRSGSTAWCRCSARCCPAARPTRTCPRSVRRFPGAEELAGAAGERAASTEVEFRLLGGSIVALHTGTAR